MAVPRSAAEAAAWRAALDDPLLRARPRAELLAHPSALAQLLDGLRAPGCDPEYARLVMHGLSVEEDVSCLAHRHGALEAALSWLGRGSESAVCDAARCLALAPCGKEEAHKRVMKLREIIRCIGSASGPDVSSTLSGLVGRHRVLSFEFDYRTKLVGDAIAQDHQLLESLAHALEAAARSDPQVESLCCAACAAATALDENDDDRRLVDANLVGALASKLPHPRAAEALWRIAKTQLGQEAVVAACGQLCACLSADDDEVRYFSARAIGRIGAFPTVRDGGFAELMRGAASPGGERCLGEAISQGQAAARAAVRQGAMELISRLLKEPATSTCWEGTLLCVRGIATHGDLADRLELLAHDAMGAAIGLLTSLPAAAWWCIAALIASSEEAREEALRLHVPQLLHNGLTTGGAVAFHACTAIIKLSTSEPGADAVATCVAPSVLGQLLLVSAPDDHAERELAHFASVVLAKLVHLQPVSTRPQFRNAVSQQAFEPALALLKLGPHPTAGTGGAELIDELAMSDVGGKLAARLVETVVNGSELAPQVASLAGQVLRRCFAVLDSEGLLTHKLARALDLPRSNEDRAAVLLLVAEVVPAAERSNFIKAGGVKPLLQSLSIDEPCVVEGSLRALTTLSSEPALGKAVLEEGGIATLLNVARASQLGTLTAVLRALCSLFGKGELEVELASALVAGGVLDLLNSALDADPDCDLGACKAVCGLLGRLACIDAGREAVLQSCRERTVHAIAGIMASETGRSIACDSIAVERLVDSLRDGRARPIDEQAALTALANLADGNAATKQSILPLLPRILPYLTLPRSTPQCVAAAASILLRLAKGGTSTLAALLEHGIFPMLLPLMRRALTSDPLDAVGCVRGLLAITVVDKVASDGTVALLKQMLEPLHAQFDPFNAHAERVALQMLLFDSAALSAHLLEAGAVEHWVRIAFHKDEWGTLRSCAVAAVNRLARSLTNADGFARCRELGVLQLVLGQLQQCGGQEAQCFVLLLVALASSKDPLCRSDFASSNALDGIARWLNPCLPFYWQSVFVVQIFAAYGTAEEREWLGRHPVVARIFDILGRGRVRDCEISTARSAFLLAFLGALPAGRVAVKRLISELSGDLSASAAAAGQLMYVISPLGVGARVAAEEGAAGGLIALLEDKGKAAVHSDAMKCLFGLARIRPEEVAAAAHECSRRVSKAIELKDEAPFTSAFEIPKHRVVALPDARLADPARFLAAIAGVSTKARASIAATVQRVFEEEDESHVLTVLCVIRGMCSRQPGAAASFAAGVVRQLEEALVKACVVMTTGRRVRAAALEALTMVAQLSEPARAAMQDGAIIPLAARLLASSISDTREATVANGALKLLLALSEAASLRLCIQAVNILDSLEHVCRFSAQEHRTLALMLLANVYAEALQVHGAREPDGEVAERNRRVRELLSKYNLAHSLVQRLTATNSHFEGAEVTIADVLRNLTAVRSLSLDETLAAALVEAAIAPRLVRFLSTAALIGDRATSADLSVAAETIGKLGYWPSLRPALVDAGADKELKAVLVRLEEVASPSEGDLRLMHMARASLDTLDGKLDSPGALMAVGAAGDDTLATMPRFHAFLSHKRSDAQDFARSLFALLAGKGFDCFLDVEGLEELSDLPLIVAGCDALIFILTDGVLESNWCLQELAAAVTAGVTVILVVKEGARWADEDGRMTCTFPPTHLVDQLEPAAVRKVFLTKALPHSNEYYSAFAQSLLKRVQAAVDGNASNAAEKSLERRKRLQASQELNRAETQQPAAAGRLQKEEVRIAARAPSLPTAARDSLGGSPFDAAFKLAEIAAKQAEVIARQSEAMERQALAFSEAIREALRSQAEALRAQAEDHHQHLNETLTRQAEAHSYQLALHMRLSTDKSSWSAEGSTREERSPTGVKPKMLPRMPHQNK